MRLPGADLKRVRYASRASSDFHSAGDRAPRDLGRDAAQEPQLQQRPVRAGGHAAAENLVQLLGHPGRGGVGDLCIVAGDGPPHRRIEAEAQAGCERRRADHPDRVLHEPLVRIADRADQAVAQIGQAADVVDHRERGDVVEQRVDGEIPPERVFLGRAERVVAPDRAAPARGVRGGPAPAVSSAAASAASAAGSGGGDGRRNVATLDRLRPELDVGQTEAPPDDPAVAEDALDFVRVRRRADVEVLRMPVQQQIAHAAAHQIGDVIELAQAVQDLQRVGVDLAA